MSGLDQATSASSYRLEVDYEGGVTVTIFKLEQSTKRLETSGVPCVARRFKEHYQSFR